MASSAVCWELRIRRARSAVGGQMGDLETLRRGRAAYDRRAWGDAYAHLRAAAEADRLAPADLERLAMAAYLTGRNDTAVDTLEGLHRVLLSDGEVSRAARWAIWLAIVLFQGGHHAQAGGWLSRAERLLDEASLDCPERGYLLVPAALQALDSGEVAQAYELFQLVAEIAGRFDDA
ncbi:MAG: hypothetical protein ACR2KP_05195, partial [Egibacteraceae bacterium]